MRISDWSSDVCSSDQAEAHATEDKKRRESAEVKNQAEALIHATEKTIADLGDKAPAADKTAVEAGIADLKTAIEAGDTEAIKAKSQALSQTAMKQIGRASCRDRVWQYV